MNKALLLLAALGFTGTIASAQGTITIKDSDLGNSTYTWTKNNTYLLDGYVFLESGGTLNIEAGTVIKGKATPTNSGEASALIITRGAKINAMGTKSEPIIFTAEADDVNIASDLTEDDRGLWGGVVILGSAPIENNAQTEINIEGVPSTETRGLYGGTVEADNSGSIKYVSIRHAGNELGVGDELNGLTLGGVGNGTTIEYIEIYANSDDGIEFFGGSVNVKYAAIAFCGDDGFDWDTGYRGKGQFWFVIQSADKGDNAGEWDGAIPDGGARFSKPEVYNATFIGSGVSGTAPNATAMLMRDATGGIIANSIFTDFAHQAIEVEDLAASKGVDSRKRMEDGDLKILNNLFYGFGSGSTLATIVRGTKGGEDSLGVYLVTHLTANGNAVADPMIKGISRTANGNLDPRVDASSPAFTGLASYPSDPFFSSVSFKGAFSAEENGVWIRDWTALSRNGYLKIYTGIEKTRHSVSEVTIYPNPSSNNAVLSFTLNTPDKVNIGIYDAAGRMIEIINAEALSAGTHQFNLETSSLQNGVYFCKISGQNHFATERIVVQR